MMGLSRAAGAVLLASLTGCASVRESARIEVLEARIAAVEARVEYLTSELAEQRGALDRVRERMPGE